MTSYKMKEDKIYMRGHEWKKI
jgi:hypothetical protein